MTVANIRFFSTGKPPGVFTEPAPTEEERAEQALSWLNLIDAYDGHLPPALDDLRIEWSGQNGINGALARVGPESDVTEVKDYIEGRSMPAP